MNDAMYFSEGPYKELLELFLGYKRGKGEKGTRNLLVTLKKISLSLAERQDAKGMDEYSVRRILDPRKGESDSSREHRVSIMRQLCAFLDSLGIPCWQVPKRYFVAPRSGFRPYIFTEKEISALLDAADSLPECRRAHGYEVVYPVLVRLLVSTGLRIGEALALSIEDIGSGGVLSIVHSKSQVSRIVPMSDSMTTLMGEYVKAIDRGSGPLFLSPYTGKRYSYDGVHYMFEKMFDRAKIVNEAGRRPRIHDVRHTFCTRSLEMMLDSGMSVYEAVPILAAYVGHVNLVDTEKYIHLTVNEYDSFINREQALSPLIPKVAV
jgi:integrase